MASRVLLLSGLLLVVSIRVIHCQDIAEDGTEDKVPEAPVFPKFTQNDLEDTKAIIQKLIDRNKEGGVPVFNAGFLRMLFHDCWGGCDGCIDFDNGGNGGIQKFFEPLFETWNKEKIGSNNLKDKMSFSDLVALAGLVAIDNAMSFEPGCANSTCTPPIPYRVGRVDCPDRSAPPNRKHFFFPGPHNHNAPILGAEFNLTKEEHTAILGAHGIGKMTKKNAAFQGQWTRENHVLNNEYYKNLLNVSLNYHQEKNAADHMFWATNSEPVMMLGVDVSLVHKTDVIPRSKGAANCTLFEASGDKPQCESADERPIVEKFARRPKFFRRVFGSAIAKVIENSKGVELYNIGEDPPSGRNVVPTREEDKGKVQSRKLDDPDKPKHPQKPKVTAAEKLARQQKKAERKAKKLERQARRNKQQPDQQQQQQQLLQQQQQELIEQQRQQQELLEQQQQEELLQQQQELLRQQQQQEQQQQPKGKRRRQNNRRFRNPRISSPFRHGVTVLGRRKRDIRESVKEIHNMKDVIAKTLKGGKKAKVKQEPYEAPTTTYTPSTTDVTYTPSTQAPTPSTAYTSTSSSTTSTPYTSPSYTASSSTYSTTAYTTAHGPVHQGYRHGDVLIGNPAPSHHIFKRAASRKPNKKRKSVKVSTKET